MVLANRRRRSAELPVLPSLTVEIVRGIDPAGPSTPPSRSCTPRASSCGAASGVDALAVAMSPELELHFRAPGSWRSR